MSCGSFFFKKKNKTEYWVFFCSPTDIGPKKKQAGGFSISFFRVWLFYFNPNNGTQRERLFCFFQKKKIKFHIHL